MRRKSVAGRNVEKQVYRRNLGLAIRGLHRILTLRGGDRPNIAKGPGAFLVSLALILLTITSALPVQAQSLSGPSYSEWRISPSSIAVQQGSYTGSISALDTKDQTGTQNQPSKYVQFGTASGEQFTGYLSFIVPRAVKLSQITSVQLMANVLAPQDTVDSWDYSIYDWSLVCCPGNT
jgi:N-terminal glycosyl-hydrolase-114-associated domain